MTCVEGETILSILNNRYPLQNIRMIIVHRSFFQCTCDRKYIYHFMLDDSEVWNSPKEWERIIETFKKNYQ